MKKIKEKPKTGKAKGTKSKSQPALAPRQAAKLMKDKYLRQFDQRQEGRESETTQAIDQLEDGGQFVADELAVHTQPHRSRQRDRRIKEKPQPGQEATKQAPGPDVQEATNSHGYTRKTFNYELWRQMLPDPDWSRYER